MVDISNNNLSTLLNYCPNNKEIWKHLWTVMGFFKQLCFFFIFFFLNISVCSTIGWTFFVSTTFVLSKTMSESDISESDIFEINIQLFLNMQIVKGSWEMIAPSSVFWICTFFWLFLVLENFEKVNFFLLLRLSAKLKDSFSITFNLTE